MNIRPICFCYNLPEVYYYITISFFIYYQIRYLISDKRVLDHVRDYHIHGDHVHEYKSFCSTNFAVLLSITFSETIYTWLLDGKLINNKISDK